MSELGIRLGNQRVRAKQAHFVRVTGAPELHVVYQPQAGAPPGLALQSTNE